MINNSWKNLLPAKFGIFTDFVWDPLKYLQVCLCTVCRVTWWALPGDSVWADARVKMKFISSNIWGENCQHRQQEVVCKYSTPEAISLLLLRTHFHNSAPIRTHEETIATVCWLASWPQDTLKCSWTHRNLNSEFQNFLKDCKMNIQLDQHVLLWRSLTPHGRRSNSGAAFPSNTLCFCVTFVYDQLAAWT